MFVITKPFNLLQPIKIWFGAAFLRRIIFLLAILAVELSSHFLFLCNVTKVTKELLNFIPAQ